MKQLFLSTILLFSLCIGARAEQPVEAPAPKTSVQQYINSELKTDPYFKRAVIGILAVDDNDRVVAEWNSNYPLLTASTLKTVTTGLGLAYLGPDYKYKTQIAYNGKIKNGVLNGDLHIIGGGDPTLGSKDTVAFAIDSIFGVWTSAIKAAGIRQINGNIVVDDSWMAREQIPSSWSWGNLGYSYGNTAHGLSFCENLQYFTMAPGENVGDPVNIQQKYPYIPGFEIINEATTGEARTGDRTEYFVQDMAPIGRFVGTLGKDRGVVESENSSRYPHLSCGYHFREYLVREGINSNPEIIDIQEYNGDMSRTQICETYSPELIEIIKVTNRISNNFFAETIYKTIGKEYTGVGSYDSARVAVENLLTEYGVSTDGLDARDGSGLSRQDFVTPEFFCNFYKFMAKNDNFAQYLESFPVPGCGGTLKNVLKDAPVEVKSRIHAKSGSLTGVRCYAGYVERANGKGMLRFIIMANNFPVSTSKLQPKIEKFMLKLAEYK